MSAIQSGAEGALYPGRDSTAPVLLPGWAPPVPARSRPDTRPEVQPRRRTRPRSAQAQADALRRGLGAIALAGTMAGLCAVGSAAVAQEGYAVDRTRAAVAGLQNTNRQLIAQLAELENPQRIAREAVDRLGMHRPAGYVPVAPVQVPPAAPAAPPRTAEVAVPLPAGPAPGGAVAIGRRLAAWTAAAWGGLGAWLGRR